MRIETSSPTVVEGQTLDLNCVVVGQPQATITWYKRGGSLPSRHQVLRGPEAVGGELEERQPQQTRDIAQCSVDRALASLEDSLPSPTYNQKLCCVLRR